MTSITKTETDQNSITLKKNSKGQYDWEIKVYFDGDEAQTLGRIANIDTALRATYKHEE